MGFCAGLVVTAAMTYLDDKIASYDTEADHEEQLWTDLIVSDSTAHIEQLPLI